MTQHAATNPPKRYPGINGVAACHGGEIRKHPLKTRHKFLPGAKRGCVLPRKLTETVNSAKPRGAFTSHLRQDKEVLSSVTNVPSCSRPVGMGVARKTAA